ncbi:MAG: class I SAM-dependent methyltransferase [Acidobacteriota bacterium]
MKKAPLLVTLALAWSLGGMPSASAQELTWASFQGYDVPFVPTPPEVVDEMLRLAGVKAGDVLYDLGCGDGRIVIEAARRYGVRAVGIDIDPIRIRESNDNAAGAGLAAKVRFIQQNLFEADFRDATVVTMYLLTSVNLRLRPKLLAELKPGTRLVSHSFGMDEWRPDKTSVVATSFGDERGVYFWIVPANVSGRWEWDLGAGAGRRHCVLEASQQFQDVTISAREGTRLLAADDVRLAGDLIGFRLEAAAQGRAPFDVYEGRVAGDTITGTVRPAGADKSAAVPWIAKRDHRTIESIAK